MDDMLKAMEEQVAKEKEFLEDPEEKNIPMDKRRVSTLSMWTVLGVICLMQLVCLICYRWRRQR